MIPITDAVAILAASDFISDGCSILNEDCVAQELSAALLAARAALAKVKGQ